MFMKKFLFLAAVAMLAGYTSADEQTAQEIQLEKEAEAFERSTAFTDPKAIEALRQRRESVKATRYKYYQQALKKNGDRILEAMNPPECKYYSTEGVCSWPNTRISPYPKIAHVNTVLNFKFPNQLSSCKAQSITVYQMEQLGYSIKYVDDAADIFADIYVYDMPQSDSPESIFRNDAILTEELKRVAGEIYQRYPDVRVGKKLSRGCFKDCGQMLFLCFGVEFESEYFNKRHTMMKSYSFALLFAKNQKFIKLRITKGGGDPKDFQNIIKDFMRDFERKVILDSQTRKRKFEKALTYPIILPK